MIQSVTVRLEIGREISFPIADADDRPPLFVLGVRKSGSSILNAICGALAAHNRYHYADIAGTFFSQNVLVRHWVRDPDVVRLLRGGNLYGGFREFPAAFATSDVFRTARKVLLVRDPRDALVSEYFSNAYSHKIPPPEQGSGDVNQLLTRFRADALAATLEESVLGQAQHMNRTLLQFAPMCSDPNCLIMKYEDVILDKRRLIGLVCRQFGWTASDALVTAILGWADVRPTSEDPTAFIRRVTPGDHADKLSPAAIARLDTVLAEAMALFGYPVEAGRGPTP